MSKNEVWEISFSEGPLVATAIHDGHQLREEVAEIMALGENERLREEDPFTKFWTTIGDTQIVGLRSRFEMDLNRPREKAVYQIPEDAWGLNVWKAKPSQELVDRSLDEYDAFYKEAYRTFIELEKQFGYFVVFDIHAYNHMRGGPCMPPADPEANPEVNIGTGSIDRSKWTNLVSRFISDLSNYDYKARKLDVRENVKFKGGHFSRWISQNFPDSACTISIEFKKFFMDEWSGKADDWQLEEIRKALESTIPGVLDEIEEIKNRGKKN